MSIGIGIGTHRRRYEDFTNTHSVLLDGVDEYINIDSVKTALASTTKGTWSCWVKPVDATPAEFEIFISFGASGTDTLVELFLNTDGTLGCFCQIPGGVRWHKDTTNPVLSDNTWTHIALVQDGTEPVLYGDGVAVAQAFIVSTDKTAWFNDLTLDTGRVADVNWASAGETNHFNGNIDRVRFWNIALSSAQILDDYNGGCPKAANQTGLVSEFAIDGDIISVATDSFGTNNGTYVNVEQADIELDVVC